MLHYNPKYWKDPYVFNPDRFSKEEELLRPKCAYFAFSQGPRDCLGKVFAQNEAVIVLGALLKNFILELDPKYELLIEMSITNKPLGGLPLKITRRRTVESS
jgi:cytochrome P450